VVNHAVFGLNLRPGAKPGDASKTRVCGLTGAFHLDINDDVLDPAGLRRLKIRQCCEPEIAPPHASMLEASEDTQRRRLQASEQASLMSLSDDMNSILRHPLFLRLKRAVLACQQVGHDEEEVRRRFQARFLRVV